MAVKKYACGRCGAPFLHESGFFPSNPAYGGLFDGWICPACVERERSEERHRETLEAEERRHQERLRAEFDRQNQLQRDRDSQREQSRNLSSEAASAYQQFKTQISSNEYDQSEDLVGYKNQLEYVEELLENNLTLARTILDIAEKDHVSTRSSEIRQRLLAREKGSERDPAQLKHQLPTQRESNEDMAFAPEAEESFSDRVAKKRAPRIRLRWILLLAIVSFGLWKWGDSIPWLDAFHPYTLQSESVVDTRNRNDSVSIVETERLRRERELEIQRQQALAADAQSQAEKKRLLYPPELKSVLFSTTEQKCEDVDFPVIDRAALFITVCAKIDRAIRDHVIVIRSTPESPRLLGRRDWTICEGPILEGWDSVHCSAARPNSGAWLPGRYIIDIVVDGKKIGSRTLTVE